LIDAELTRGQRADGTPPQDWRPWVNAKFAATFAASANAVANWRNPSRLNPPDNIVPLLNTFYGDQAPFAAQRQAMLKLWRQARGYDVDDAPPLPVLAVTERKSFQGPVYLVDLRAHPVPANDGTVRLAATLVISPDDGVLFQGKAVSIGLTDALLTLQSAAWQPTHLSMIGEKPHENYVRIAQGTRIVGPRDRWGRLDGLPFGEEPIAIIERIGKNDGPVTLTVLAPPSSFDVRTRAAPDASTPFEERAVSDTQKVVLDALFQEQLTSHDERRAAVLASVTLDLPERIP
jgi:hypothetical protein